MDADNAQAEILKNSGIISEFVRRTGGTWSQADLEELLNRIKEQNIAVPTEVVGTLLEAERAMQKPAKAEGEVTVNFDQLSLRNKRRYLESEIRNRIR